MMFADFLGISDVIWQALIGAVVTITLAKMSYDTQKAVKKGTDNAISAADDAQRAARTAKVAIEEQSARTAEKLSDIQQTGNNVHSLVNSAMGIQLKIAESALSQVAELLKVKAAASKLEAERTKTEKDIATAKYDEIASQAAIKAAELAKSALHEHELKQAHVDAGNKRGDQRP